MIFFPNAKINIGLKIRSKRTDGFHNIESIIYPVPVYDILEILPGTDQEILFCNGREIPGNKEENICMQAVQLLRKKHNFPFVRIYLYKNIPPGSGLGGGSSDAAYTLWGINHIFGLGIDHQGLENYASKLGSDVPFFLAGSPCLVSGKGERIQKVNMCLTNFFYTIIYPGFRISTSEAYAGVKAGKSIFNPEYVLKNPPVKWQPDIVNDFELILFKKHPLLFKLKKKLMDAGYDFVSLSGSGSAIYGISSKKISVREPYPENYLVFEGQF